MSGFDDTVLMNCWWPVYVESTGEMCKYVYIRHNDAVYFAATSENRENKGRLFNVKDSYRSCCDHSEITSYHLASGKAGNLRLLKASINLITGEVHAS